MEQEEKKLKQQETMYREAMDSLQGDIDKLAKENDLLKKSIKSLEDQSGKKATKFTVESTPVASSDTSMVRCLLLFFSSMYAFCLTFFCLLC